MTTDETAAGAVPPVVRNKALAAGAGRWLRDLPGLIAELERDWSITVSRSYDGPGGPRSRAWGSGPAPGAPGAGGRWGPAARCFSNDWALR